MATIWLPKNIVTHKRVLGRIGLAYGPNLLIKLNISINRNVNGYRISGYHELLSKFTVILFDAGICDQNLDF